MGDFVRGLLVQDWIGSNTRSNVDNKLSSVESLFDVSFWGSNDWQFVLENDRLAQLLLRTAEEQLIEENISDSWTDFENGNCQWNTEIESKMKKLIQYLEKKAFEKRIDLVNKLADCCICLGDEHELRAVQEYIDAKGLKTDVEEMYSLVQQELECIETKRSITEAHRMRNVDDVPKLLKYAKSRAYLQDQLRIELEHLEAALGKWNAEDRLRNHRIKVDAKSFAELRSYSNPTKEIFSTVKASLILLGFESRNVINWGDILTIFTSCKANKTDLVKCFNSLNCNAVRLETAFESEMVLRRSSLEKVNHVSSGAALFYKWSVQKIAAVKKAWGVVTSSRI